MLKNISTLAMDECPEKGQESAPYLSERIEFTLKKDAILFLMAKESNITLILDS